MDTPLISSDFRLFKHRISSEFDLQLGSVMLLYPIIFFPNPPPENSGGFGKKLSSRRMADHVGKSGLDPPIFQKRQACELCWKSFYFSYPLCEERADRGYEK